MDAVRQSLDAMATLWKPLRSRNASAEKRSALADECAFWVNRLRHDAGGVGCDLEAIAPAKKPTSSK